MHSQELPPDHYLPEYVARLLETILEFAGIYIILGAPPRGKTAGVRYIGRELRQTGHTMLLYIAQDFGASSSLQDAPDALWHEPLVWSERVLISKKQRIEKLKANLYLLDERIAESVQPITPCYNKHGDRNHNDGAGQ